MVDHQVPLPDRGGGGSVGGPALQQAVIPSTQLSNGEFISFRVFVPDGKVIEIFTVGVQNDANNAPAGLTAEVDDETNAVNLVSKNAKRVSGDPITSKAGPISVAFRTENDTGATQNATGTFGFTVE